MLRFSEVCIFVLGEENFMDYYYNHVPGRLRIQTPFIHGSPQNAATFEKNILGLEGITSVETNPVTGSALILFDEKKIEYGQIISFLEKQGYFILSKAKTFDMDYYYNYMPGRLRIQTPFIHGSPQNATIFEKYIQGLEGITSVETNPVTGSALILFDEKKIKYEQITSFLEKQGYFILSKAKASDMDYYYHYVPGRLRIQTPFIRGNPQNAAIFEKNIQGLEGITSVETNPVTGSALILFDEKRIKYEQITSFLEKQGYFILSKAKTSDEVIEQAAEKVLDVAEKIVVDSVDGGIEDV